jgi:hypothetical protein
MLHPPQQRRFWRDILLFGDNPFNYIIKALPEE